MQTPKAKNEATALKSLMELFQNNITHPRDFASVLVCETLEFFYFLLLLLGGFFWFSFICLLALND